MTCEMQNKNFNDKALLNLTFQKLKIAHLALKNMVPKRQMLKIKIMSAEVAKFVGMLC